MKMTTIIDIRRPLPPNTRVFVTVENGMIKQQVFHGEKFKGKDKSSSSCSQMDRLERSFQRMKVPFPEQKMMSDDLSSDPMILLNEKFQSNVVVTPRLEYY